MSRNVGKFVDTTSDAIATSRSSSVHAKDEEAGTTDIMGPEDEKRLVRKIDRQYVNFQATSLPMLTICIAFCRSSSSPMLYNSLIRLALHTLRF